jgi:hypothetical protein
MFIEIFPVQPLHTNSIFNVDSDMPVYLLMKSAL